MSRLERLKATTTLHGLARLLGYRCKALAYILYGKSPKYHEFTIPKRSGSREISAPISELKLIQRRLANLLQDCIKDINTKKNIDSALSHGFRRKHSIVTNASKHKNKRYVFNVDLTNFFGSINFGRVRGFFIKNENFKLESAVATVVAQIACHNNALPQGSPCSPVISNLIGHILDIRLVQLAKQYGCHYSRYADDITFSTNLKEFPYQIACLVNASTHQYGVGRKLESVITNAGFSINPDKTRLQYTNSRQDVTGLIVNKKVNTRSQYWRTARAMAHKLFATGEFKIVFNAKDGSGNPNKLEKKGSLDQLQGILSFIHHVDSHSTPDANLHNHNKNSSSREQLFKKFLFYKLFYAPTMPMVLCEGKTDAIYIRCAIQQLFKSYPSLVEDVGGKPKLLVRLFKYTDNNSRLLHLSGGAGSLSKFIGEYGKHFSGYKAPGSMNPVVIVVDNDDASKKIFSVVKKLGGSSHVNGDESFYHVICNLYLCPIPKIQEKETVIEDYFEKEVLATELDGRKFHRTNGKYDKKKEYGKNTFAEDVVRKNKGTINFENFSAVLKGIQKAINEHTYWHEHVSQFISSGLTQQAYCAQNSLPIKTFQMYAEERLKADILQEAIEKKW